MQMGLYCLKISTFAPYIMKRHLLTLVLLLFQLTLFAQAQDELTFLDRFDTYSRFLSPEKLYLHTDKEVYCVGDTIWFKGYLKNSSSLSEFSESNYIYVELISALAQKNVYSMKDVMVESVKERVKIKRINGEFVGHIAIPKNLNTGVAVVRGYSYWMMNYAPEYMFYKNIELRNPMKDSYVESLDNKDEKTSEKYLEAGVLGPNSKSKRVKEDIDIQFLPESGRYTVGHNSVIAFKAINSKGKGIKVTGEVFDKQNSKLAQFKSSDLGMGILHLNTPAIPEKMYAIVKTESGDSVKVDFPLPSQSAVVINMNLTAQSVMMNVYSNAITPAQSANIVIYNNTEIYYQIPYNFDTKSIRLSNSNFTPGINNVAVVDDAGNVYAHRTFFIYNTSENISYISTDKESYKAREKVSCAIDLKQINGTPLSGNFSVSVTDNEYAPYSNQNHNIKSYMLLGSELEGHVENPQYYFETDSSGRKRYKEMDYLMLTQGWRYYDLPKILQGELHKYTLGKEYSQTISGKVTSFLGKKKETIVSFIAPSINYATMGMVDTTGWFALENLNFPNGTQFIVSTVGSNGIRKRFAPDLEPDIFAKELSYPKFLQFNQYSKEYRNTVITNMYDLGDVGEGWVETIDPIYIVGTNTSKQKNISPLPSYEFKEGQFRNEQALSPFLTYDLPSYIVATCPPLKYDDSLGFPYIVCPSGRGSTRMQPTGGWAPIIVYINGMLYDNPDIAFQELTAINVTDIDGFAYIKGIDAAKFNNSLEGSLFPRSVIMISTKMLERAGARNVAATTPLGWQKPARTYFPKYTTPNSKTIKEPLRSLLYWEPNVIITDGKANIDFYTSDNKSTYTIIVEGLTENNEPVFIKKEITRE